MFGLEYKHVTENALRKHQWAKLVIIKPMAKNWLRLLIQRADDGFWPIDVSVPMKKTQAQLDDALLIETVRVIKKWEPNRSV